MMKDRHQQHVFSLHDIVYKKTERQTEIQTDATLIFPRSRLEASPELAAKSSDNIIEDGCRMFSQWHLVWYLELL